MCHHHISRVILVRDLNMSACHNVEYLKDLCLVHTCLPYIEIVECAYIIGIQ